MELKYFTKIKTLKIFKEKCTGCGMCIEVCPHNVFKIENKIAVTTNLDRCMECGACKINCQFGAIEVETGVGCAAAIIYGLLHNTEPICGCSDDSEDDGESTSGCC